MSRNYAPILWLILIELIVIGFILFDTNTIMEKTMTKREYNKPVITELSPECGVIHNQIQDMFDDGGTLEWKCDACKRVFYPPTVDDYVRP